MLLFERMFGVHARAHDRQKKRAADDEMDRYQQTVRVLKQQQGD